MELDWTMLEWIHSNLQSDLMDHIMPFITGLGNSGFIWIVTGVVLFCTRKYRKGGLLLLIGLALGMLTGNVLLKPLIARPRPCWLDVNVQLLINNPTDYSFPSGHTLSSTIGATILTLTNYRFGFWAIPLALLIAFSRVYLFVHFPSDILGGILIGLIIGIAVYFLGTIIPPVSYFLNRQKPGM